MQYRTAASVLSEQVEGRTLLIDAGADELITLNPVGSVVWAGLEDGVSTVDALVELVATRFPDAPAESVADDVRGFLDELVAAQLVEGY